MRVAVVSDIHANRTAFEAVLADLKQTAPDMIYHGGDLGDLGSSGPGVIDQLRDLGWPGVLGNTDEMLFDPQSLEQFAAPLPQLKGMFDALREMAAFSRETLGEDRLAWLRSLPRQQSNGSIALVHASPATTWRSPMPEATDAELESTYAPLAHSVIVYGHIHRPYIRTIGPLTIANSGSVGQPHDGDPRASYLLIDDGVPAIRRVEYDVPRELKALSTSGLPYSKWIAKILQTARPQTL